MKLELKILESNSEINKAILKSIREHMDNAINQSINSISSAIKSIVSEALRSQPEYASLMAGTLKAEFGIPNSSVVNAVIDDLVNTLKIHKNNITINNFGLKGGLELTMIKSDDINGITENENAMVKNNDQLLPWLHWLLLEGNNSIVKNYDVEYTKSIKSRSGMAIMTSSDNSWRVPPDFAGTAQDNWTTRAIDSVENDILSIIQQEIEKNI